jgi:diguanylate cyclase (GGDEF)-like protein
VYGHATGDALLRLVAQRLQAEVRGGDSVCRLGGDEFVCVIGAPASSEDVRAVAQRLRRAVCRPYEIGSDSYVVGCSVGVSMHPQHGTTAESLLARADSAMYAAKASGGGVTVFTSPSPSAGSLYV